MVYDYNFNYLMQTEFPKLSLFPLVSFPLSFRRSPNQVSPFSIDSEIFYLWNISGISRCTRDSSFASLSDWLSDPFWLSSTTPIWSMFDPCSWMTQWPEIPTHGDKRSAKAPSGLFFSLASGHFSPSRWLSTWSHFIWLRRRNAL